MYRMGLTQLILETDSISDLDVIHIVADPRDLDSLVWLSDEKCLSCVKSFVVSGVQNDFNTNPSNKSLIVEKNWLGPDVTYHKIDLSYQTLTFCVSAYNQSGDLCSTKGFCIFDVC